MRARSRAHTDAHPPSHLPTHIRIHPYTLKANTVAKLQAREQMEPKDKEDKPDTTPHETIMLLVSVSVGVGVGVGMFRVVARERMESKPNNNNTRHPAKPLYSW